MTTIQYIADQLLANDPTANDYFGCSVAISGDTAVVGAYNWSRKAVNGVTALSDCGCAYVFIKNGATWNFKQQLFANDPSASDHFGISVAINNNTIVIGARQWSRKVATGITALSNCGCAYVFTYNGIKWSQEKQLFANDPRASDFFGWYVAIDGNIIVISANYWDRKVATGVTALSDCGSAYVFTYNGVEWIQEKQLLAPDPSATDRFASTVAISNNTIVIGTSLWDSKAEDGVTAQLFSCGCAYVFVRNETEWSLQQQLFANDLSAGDSFSVSVAIHNDTIVIGATGWDRKVDINVTALASCGCAYVFIRNNTVWSLQQQLLANDPTASDIFGYRIALSTDTIIITALSWSRKAEDGVTIITAGCGCIYVFVKNDTVWTQQTQLVASDFKADDRFGDPIAMSGTSVIIGALFWDRKVADGVTALPNCGAAYIADLKDLGLYFAPVVINKNYTFAFNWTETKLINGNIGIRTNTPNKTLDINGDLNINGNIYVNNILTSSDWYIENNNNIKYNETGNIGIGQNTALYKVDVNGTIRATSYLTNSDLRLKENIEDEYLGLEYIKTLKPKVYNYINDMEKKTIHGFIAQDINEDINTDIITTDNNGILAINLHSLISPITKAIQELNIIQENLKTEVIMLEQIYQ